MDTGVFYCRYRQCWVVLVNSDEVETAPSKAEALAKLDHIELEQEANDLLLYSE
jgi:hypothetical protein